jgi:hypothetical protein
MDTNGERRKATVGPSEVVLPLGVAAGRMDTINVSFSQTGVWYAPICSEFCSFCFSDNWALVETTV